MNKFENILKNLFLLHQKAIRFPSDRDNIVSAFKRNNFMWQWYGVSQPHQVDM